MAIRIGFYVLPKGAAGGARGQRLGEMKFASEKDRETFIRGVSMLTDTSLAPLFSADGSSMTSKEAGQMLAKIDKAVNATGENTLSSAMSAEVMDIERGTLAGTLDTLCDLLKQAAKGGGLLTTLPE
jgi:hypothetical protein